MNNNGDRKVGLERERVGGILLATLAWLVSISDAVALPAESRLKATSSYEHVEATRRKAAELLRKGTIADLKTAKAQLESALEYLSRAHIQEVSTGSMPLYSRGYAVRLDLARVYARLGEKTQALSALEEMQRLAWSPQVGASIAADEDFTLLQDEPRFKRFLANAALSERLWKVPAIATPYQEKLSIEERVAGLSLYWAEARQNFVYFDNAPDLEWDRVYVSYLSKVLGAESTLDYYRIMMQLAPLLRDGHTNIYPPHELRDRFYARPPVNTALVEKKVLITSLSSPTVAARLHVGEEIVAIDDVPVEQYAEERVAPFVSASTPQDRAVRMYSYQLLAGDAGKPLKLRVRTPEGREREETIARAGYTDLANRPRFEFKILGGNVAYISLDHFESDEGVKAFERALPQIMKARALIIDVRRNGGGSSEYGLDVLSYLSTSPIPQASSRQRSDFAYQRNDSIRWWPVSGPGDAYVRQRSQHFDGPVAVLMGPQTFSAAEDFLVSFDLMKRGSMIGEPSGGSTGQPMYMSLPGGGLGRICIKRDTYPDGSDFVGRGVVPTLLVKQTVEDVRNGSDAVLDRALATLSN